MDGFLLINKPKGWTSFDVVAKIRSTLRSAGYKKSKVGHAGTLDPMATGLLIVLIGAYCKQASNFSKLDKTYRVTMCLGQISTTGDQEGEKTSISDIQPSLNTITMALNKHTGAISQIPPAYSAVKINGQRAYKLARKGIKPKLEPREVKVYSITEVAYDYPNVCFTTRVSSGTYIRSLVEDIGDALKTGAFMSDLCRTGVGAYDLGSSMDIDGVIAKTVYQQLQG